MSEEIIKDSVIIEPLTDKMWRASGETGIPYKVVVTDGNWGPWLPVWEDQERHPGFDSVSCVTFSGENIVETELNRLIDLKLMPQTHLDFLNQYGYIKDGKVNFSDRFSSILSGTTPNGNYMSNVPDSFARDGLIPESMLPFPEDVMKLVKKNPDGSIAQDGKAIKYYLDPTCITQEMKDLGQKFKKYFDVRYEVVDYGNFGKPNLELIKKHLLQAPLHFAAKVCPGENSEDVIQACGPGAGHARMIYSVDQVFQIFDSFFKAKKKLALDFPLPYIYKIVMTVKTNPAPIQKFTHDFKVRIVPEDLKKANPGMYPENDGSEVIALQRALQLLTNRTTGKPYLDPRIIPVPNFGPLTKAAVIAFQTDRNVATPGEIKIAGGTVGPKTRVILTSSLLTN